MNSSFGPNKDNLPRCKKLNNPKFIAFDDQLIKISSVQFNRCTRFRFLFLRSSSSWFTFAFQTVTQKTLDLPSKQIAISLSECRYTSYLMENVICAVQIKMATCGSSIHILLNYLYFLWWTSSTIHKLSQDEKFLDSKKEYNEESSSSM